MIKAILMIGDRLVGIQEIYEPLPAIRFCVSMMAEPTILDDSSVTSSMTSSIMNHRIIFRIHRRIGYDQYEYQYSHLENNEKFTVLIQESFDFLREPDEKINLNKLKQKLRNKEDMTKLLLRYYRN